MNFRDLALPAVIGIGLYAHANSINLTNNTTTLLELLLLAIQQTEIRDMERQILRLNNVVFGTPFPCPPTCDPVINTPFAAARNANFFQAI
jgi:hypothetical protein